MKEGKSDREGKPRGGIAMQRNSDAKEAGMRKSVAAGSAGAIVHWPDESWC